MTDQDVPLEILIHRAAAARGELRRAAAVADQAKTAASDARRLSDEAQAAVLVKINLLMDASDREAAASHEEAARRRAGDWSGVTAREVINRVEDILTEPVDLAAAAAAERSDTGGGACS